MKNLFRDAVLFALLMTACNPSEPPEDADVAILFKERGCDLLKAPDGEIPNPFHIAMKNTTEKEYAVVIFTLLDGYDRNDLEAYTSPDLPPFVATFDHLDPKPKGDWLVVELQLKPDAENYFVCAQEEVGLLSVPLALHP